MEFRLVFEGSLRSGQSSGVVAEKHAIRKAIHKQLAQLWQVRDIYYCVFVALSWLVTEIQI
jgi:hypothetical protein